jgi:hypothetical protein
MKKILFVLLTTFALAACGPAEVPVWTDIKPNQSAYVIPLEGASQKNQGKFDSADFLEKQKVATKRIYIPLKKVSTGRMWGDFQWIPTVKVVTVDRSPVTFVWEGTDPTNGGIKVESRDSIGFAVGINVSAHIKEGDTSLFLYSYSADSLAIILREIVKSKTTEVLSREFARYDLEGGPDNPGARQRKGEIVELAKAELKTYFEATGVTISTFGLIGGLAYEDKEIQIAINDNFKSELEIQNAVNEKLEQVEINLTALSVAINDKSMAQEFAQAAEARSKLVNLNVSVMLAEAELEKAKRWDGKLPSNIMPDGANFILGMK